MSEKLLIMLRGLMGSETLVDNRVPAPNVCQSCCTVILDRAHSRTCADAQLFRDRSPGHILGTQRTDLSARRSSGEEERFSLGVYPEVSLKEARNRRDERASC